MLDTAARKPIALTDTQQPARESSNIVSRKIWLPKLLYNSLPYFYLVSGLAAFFATLYISEWFWVLPHYLLFASACLHLGFAVLRKRRRAKTGTTASELS